MLSFVSNPIPHSSAHKLSFVAVLAALLVVSAVNLARAMDPVPIWTRSGSGDEISRFDMDIASDGRIFVAGQYTGTAGEAIIILYSEDDGFTWSILGALASADPQVDYLDPAIHVAEGDENRLFVVYGACNAGDFITSVELDYWNLDDLSEPRVPLTIDGLHSLCFNNVAITTDAHLRPDYGVFIGVTRNVKFGYTFGFARSLDQGTTWEPGYSTVGTGAGGVSGAELAVLPGGKLIADTGVGSNSVILRAENLGAVSSDWSLAGVVNGFISTTAPALVTAPDNTLFAGYTERDTESFFIHRSEDEGLTWTDPLDATVLPIQRATLAVGPLGFRTAGVNAGGEIVFGEPDGIDPDGDWILYRTIPEMTDTGVFRTVQLASSPTQGHSWAVLGHREESDEESLLFWAEWFDEAAGLEDHETDTSRVSALGLQVSPNPTADRASLRWNRGVGTRVGVTIVSAGGRLVHEGASEPGTVSGEYDWDLRDQRGERVPAGVYFATAKASAGQEQVRIVVR